MTIDEALKKIADNIDKANRIISEWSDSRRAAFAYSFQRGIAAQRKLETNEKMDTKKYQKWLNEHWELHTPEAVQSTLFYLAACAMQEAGEAFDVIKKPARQQSNYDPILTREERWQLIDECGDVLAYLTRLLNRADSSIEEALWINHEKIMQRYGEFPIEGSQRVGDGETTE